jgi:DNA-binding NarL/FixJ family response regulator
MNLHKQSITVAIADTDHNRRAGYERFLKSERGISLLSDDTSNNESANNRSFVDRRSKPRMNITPSEDEIARIKRLKPLVLLVDMNQCTDDDYALLLSIRYECPEAKVVLLVDDSIPEDQLFEALKIGARGFLKYEKVQMQLSNAIQAVGNGEVWVTRKMFGSLMNHLLN